MPENSPLQPVDATAPTLEEAIESGLKTLGLPRSEVIMEVIDEGTRGVLGLGARHAVVRLTPLRSTPASSSSSAPATRASVDTPSSSTQQEFQEEADAAVETLSEILKLMDVQADIEVHQAQPDALDPETPWVLNLEGNDLGALIGRRGDTLEALQYMARLVVSRRIQRHAAFVVDVGNYKSRREDTLRKLARRMADQVRQTGRAATLEPMPPNERRVIHITLREDKFVTTESTGDGDRRKVTIVPTRISTD
jgi:spoIIIJ-associated protein